MRAGSQSEMNPWRGLACCCLAFLTAGCSFESEIGEPLLIQEASPKPVQPTRWAMWVDVPGIKNPNVFPGNDVDQRVDVEEVIGIVVGDRARAYLVEAFEVGSQGSESSFTQENAQILERHVVNDVVGDLPVSITYCDKTLCKDVFTAPGETPLKLSVAGWSGQAMALRYNDVVFAQSETNPPLGRLPFQATTWGEWKKLYPQTDIYLGRLARGYTSRAGSELGHEGSLVPRDG